MTNIKSNIKGRLYNEFRREVWDESTDWFISNLEERETLLKLIYWPTDFRVNTQLNSPIYSFIRGRSW